VIGSLKRIARRTAAACGLFDTARLFSSRWPRILMYHNFCGPAEALDGCTPADMLRQQLVHIKQRYHPVALAELSRALATNAPLPPRSIVITVDDGYVSFRRWAFPLLQEYQVPATLFVVSDFLDSGEWLWTDKFTCVREAANGRANLSGDQGRDAMARLKRLPPAERDQSLDELAQRAGVAIPAHAPAPYALLSWEELEELAHSGLIDIGSHSRTHAILGSIGTDESWQEVSGSRRELERRLGVEVASFCYPNGLASDYRPDHIEMVAKAGYRCATAAHFGYVKAESNRFALPRVGGDVIDMASFRMRLDGFEYLQRRVTGGRCW